MQPGSAGAARRFCKLGTAAWHPKPYPRLKLTFPHQSASHCRCWSCRTQHLKRFRRRKELLSRFTASTAICVLIIVIDASPCFAVTAKEKAWAMFEVGARAKSTELRAI